MDEYSWLMYMNRVWEKVCESVCPQQEASSWCCPHLLRRRNLYHALSYKLYFIRRLLRVLPLSLNAYQIGQWSVYPKP